MRFQIGVAALASGLTLSGSAVALEAGHCAADLTKPVVLAQADASERAGDVEKGSAERQAPQPVPPADTVAAPAEVLSAPKGIDAVPALKHIAATGATLLDLGEKHGLRAVAARSGDQFMILQAAPDGQAVVGGPMLDLSEARLMAIGGSQVTSVGEQHGLNGLLLRNGSEMQVLYVTPDRQATIAGVMWDATGKNLTRDQVAKIDGAVPTVVLNDADKAFAGKASGSALASVEKATFGVYGRDGAPQLWMIFDPACTYSIRAFDQLKPYVEAGRVQLRIVPISILDHEDSGMSTKAALALLSNQPERMAELWAERNFGAQPSVEATAKLRANGLIAEGINLTGTPTFIFRKPDGSEGRVDGLPIDTDALVAEVAGRG